MAVSRCMALMEASSTVTHCRRLSNVMPVTLARLHYATTPFVLSQLVARDWGDLRNVKCRIVVRAISRKI